MSLIQSALRLKARAFGALMGGELGAYQVKAPNVLVALSAVKQTRRRPPGVYTTQNKIRATSIGRGIAIQLWRQGANVVVLSNQPENLAALKKEYPSIEIICVDLRDWDSTRALVDSIGVLDGLVNNAGIAIIEPFLECSPESLDETMSVNVKAILNVSQVIAKKMIENNIKGSIVNISSQASKAALKDHVAYCASKGAVDSLSRVMALELGPHGIRVNTVNPTVIMTDMGRKVWAAPEKSQGMLSKIPLGRFGEVHEVVDTVLFLLSDSANMISGVHLPVDGGFLAT